MYKTKLVWQLFFSYLLIISVSMIAASWYASDYIRRTYLDFIKSDLETFARFIKMDIKEKQIPLESADLDELCRNLSDISGKRLTVILTDGRVVGESDVNFGDMDNHANRPEILDALQGKIGESLRYSDTVQQVMQYIAIPIFQENQVKGVIRISYPGSSIEKALRSIYLQIILGEGAISLLAIIISWYFSQKISYPLKKLKLGALRFAKEKLSTPIKIKGTEEFELLAEAMNSMAKELSQRIDTIRQQSNQQEAILSSMVEGVVALNTNKEIISINRTASKWLGINGDAIKGKNIVANVKNEGFVAFLNEALHSDKPIEHEIELNAFDTRYVQAHSSALRNADGSLSGSVIMMHDISHIRRLENMRQEFVGNVSHELKTPITTIKGFVETLQDGAIHDIDDAKHFLAIVLKQANRLHSIIEDLLSLSRIEQEEQQGSIPLTATDLILPIRTAVDNCTLKAKDKNITLVVDMNNDIQIEINSRLLEQALVNLIDNAIKYSDPNSSIVISVNDNEYETVISVQDTGCGIPKEHFSRLFERFYRVDKARSRTLGGTGLGLAIVKHISQAHNGYVHVESEVGTGSTFHIHIPKTQ